MPKYPEIEVELVGNDGNAFSILDNCRRQARGKLSNDELKEFMDGAMSGDYNHLLRTCMNYFTCS